MSKATYLDHPSWRRVISQLRGNSHQNFFSQPISSLKCAYFNCRNIQRAAFTS